MRPAAALSGRRLSRAVGPEQRDHLAARDRRASARRPPRCAPKRLANARKRIIAAPCQSVAEPAGPTRRPKPSDARRRSAAARGRRRVRDLGQTPAAAPAGRRVLDGHRLEHRERPLGGAESRGREALGEEVGRGQVAAEVVEDATRAVRPVAPAVAVEVGLVVVRTSSCRRTSVSGPASDQRERRQVADEGVALEAVPRAGVVEHDRDVRLGDDVAAERRCGTSPRGRSRGRCRRSGCPRPRTSSQALKQQADRREAAVVQETVAAEDDPLRVHERRAGGAVLEERCPRRRCRPRTCSAGRSADRARCCRRSCRATRTGCRSRRARRATALPASRKPSRVPDVDAGALLAGLLAGDAANDGSLRPRLRRPRAGRRRRASSARGSRGSVTSRRGDVNAGGIAAEIAAAARRRCRSPRRTTPSARTRTTLPLPEPEAAGARGPTSRTRRSIDQVAAVRPGPDLERRARRCRVDPRLERRRFRRRGPALQPAAAAGAIVGWRRRAGGRSSHERSSGRPSLAPASAPGLAPGEDERGEQNGRDAEPGHRSPRPGRSRPRSSRASCSRTAAA